MVAVETVAVETVNSRDSFFPADLADRLQRHIGSLKWSYGWRSNFSMGYAHWNCDIANAGTSNGLDVEGNIDGVVKEAWDFIKANYLPDHVLIRCYANTHTYGVEGYPHTDSRRDQDTTVVVYMNKTWKREWGGETLIYNGDRIEHAELPAFNRALMFNGNRLHCARGVTRICPEQRLTLMFKAAKVNADVDRDNLQRLLVKYNAQHIDHKNGSLMHHLLMTYDILKQAGAAQHVCLAGGAHSVFGTNAFHAVCIPEDRRDELEACIGSDAMKLVDLFRTIDRPGTLTENIGKDKVVLRLTAGGITVVDKSLFDDLVMLECANLDEQSALSKHKLLNQVWKDLQTKGNP